jgi:hypothetical protein
VIRLNPKHASLRDDGIFVKRCYELARASIVPLKAWIWKLKVFADHVAPKTGDPELVRDIAKFDPRATSSRLRSGVDLSEEIRDFMDKFSNRVCLVYSFIPCNYTGMY